ncbi:hypothetical protein BDR26DRAFT_916035 [Obelidium mucronatum]|nr:hypothetical protein BDR26DRAFT_916035 [Obelidium mucronatum]
MLLLLLLLSLFVAMPSLADFCGGDCSGLCGYISDGCGGSIFCGDCCYPLTCAKLGLIAGSKLISDGCEGVIRCGCPAGRTIRQDNSCCTPNTCKSLGKCGINSDGCGGTLNCAPCCIPKTCSSFGLIAGSTLISDECAGEIMCGCPVGSTLQPDNTCCTPNTCESLGKCGINSDGCGGTLNCAPCCIPKTCSSFGLIAGSTLISDECAGEIMCGCPVGSTLQPDNTCCTPNTCESLGKCGINSDGCGGTLNCAPCCIPKTCSSFGLIAGSTLISDECAGEIMCGCPVGSTLQPDNTCCTPNTCESLGKCGINSDGCGGTLNCAPCCIPKTCSSFGLIAGSTLISDECAGEIMCGCPVGSTLQPDNTCCTPNTCESLGKCGINSDGCGGTLNCAPCCIPKTCSSFGLIAGSTLISDECAGEIMCGCPVGSTLQPDNTCCTPNTCESLGKCGINSDGCGGTLNCAPCCIPKTCSSMGLITGSTSISDGCAGQISCGCSGGRSLQPDGSCCTPKTCSSFGFNEGRMFMASDGCGSTIPCSCPNGQTLVNGDCKAKCIPAAKYPDASMNCGYVDDGCGGSVQLATCSIPGQVCGAFKPNTCGTPLKDSDYVSLLVADVINLSPTCAASCLTNIRSLSDLQSATSAANLTAVCGSIMNLNGYKSCATSACQSSTTNIDRVSTFVETIQTHCIQATLPVPVAASYSAETKILTFTWTGNSGSITALSVSLDGGKTFVDATIVAGKPAARRSNNKRAQSVSFTIPSFTFPSCKVDALVQYSFCQGTLDLFGKCLGGAVSNHQKAISLSAKEFPGSGWPLKTCASGLNCGTVSDRCDGVISCGECSGGVTCLNNKCPVPTLTSSTTTASTVLTASTTTATATSSTTASSTTSSATSTAPTEVPTVTSATSTVSTSTSVSTTANSSSSTSSTTLATTAIATPATTTAVTPTAPSFTINCGTGSTCFLCVVNNSNTIRQECKQGEISTPLIGATTVQPNQQQVYACLVNGSEQVAQLCDQGSRNAVSIAVPAVVASDIVKSVVVGKAGESSWMGVVGSGDGPVVGNQAAETSPAGVVGPNGGVAVAGNTVAGSVAVGSMSNVQTVGSVNNQLGGSDSVKSMSVPVVAGKNSSTNLFVKGSSSVTIAAQGSSIVGLLLFYTMRLPLVGRRCAAAKPASVVSCLRFAHAPAPKTGTETKEEWLKIARDWPHELYAPAHGTHPESLLTYPDHADGSETQTERHETFFQPSFFKAAVVIGGGVFAIQTLKAKAGDENPIAKYISENVKNRSELEREMKESLKIQQQLADNSTIVVLCDSVVVIVSSSSASSSSIPEESDDFETNPDRSNAEMELSNSFYEVEEEWLKPEHVKLMQQVDVQRGRGSTQGCLSNGQCRSR